MLRSVSAATAPITTLTGSRCKLPVGSSHCPRPSRHGQPRPESRRDGIRKEALPFFLRDNLARDVGQTEEEPEFTHRFQPLRTFPGGRGRIGGHADGKRDEESGQPIANIHGHDNLILPYPGCALATPSDLDLPGAVPYETTFGKVSQSRNRYAAFYPSWPY